MLRSSYMDVLLTGNNEPPPIEKMSPKEAKSIAEARMPDACRQRIRYLLEKSECGGLSFSQARELNELAALIKQSTFTKLNAISVLCDDKFSAISSYHSGE